MSGSISNTRFGEANTLLSLYNELSEKRCDNVDDLKVVTLEDAIYMEVKNDIAFLVGTDISTCMNTNRH